MVVFFLAVAVAMWQQNVAAWGLPTTHSPRKGRMAASPTVVTVQSQRRAALHFALTYVAYCCVYLERKPVSVVKPMLQSELGLATGELALVDTAWLSLYAVGQLSLGSVKASPRVLLATSFAMSGMFTALCGMAQSSRGLAAMWGLNGLFQASINPLLVLHVADLFPASMRASAVGAWQTSQQVGGITANLFAAATLESAGWRAIFARSGVAVAALALPLYALLGASSRAPQRDKAKAPTKMAGVRWAAGAYFLVKMTRYCLMFWLPFFLVKAAGLDAAGAAKLATLFDMGGALGAVSAGVVTDKIFGGKMLAACAPFAASTAALLLVYARLYKSGTLLNALCMFAVGFCVAAPDGVLGGAAARNLCDYNAVHADAAPAVSGLINGCGSIGAIAQGLGTSLVVAHTGWTGLFFALATLMGLATLLLIPPIRLEGRRS